jgi:hypothetical protein
MQSMPAMTTDDDDVADERSSLKAVDEILEELRAGGVTNLGFYRLIAKLRRQLRENWGITNGRE